MMKEQQKKRKWTSYADTSSIWVTTIFLVVFGLIMIYSASGMTYIVDENYGNNSMYLFQRQLVFVLLGFWVCSIIQFFDYRMLYPFSKLFFAGGIASIFLLLSPMGVSVNGATRWLSIAGIRFQVAELVKITVIILLAYMIERFSNHLNKVQLILLIWAIAGGVALLLLKISNDLSSSVVVLGITFGTTFVYCKREKLHFNLLITAAMAVALYVWNIWRDLPSADVLKQMSFRVGRIAAWLNPELYASDQGYQTLQALYAIGSGGFWGKGLGNSIQKIDAIPEAQNDMIFSIICEELGVFGVSLLLFLILFLIWNLYKVSISTKNLYGSVIVTGVSLHIAIQTIINVAVNCNVFPNTGIGLPFISYGGTAVFLQLVEIALVLSIGRVAEGKKMINFFTVLKNKSRNAKDGRR